ncbi:hypothetical protein OT109_14450 [Phycisphaeraceae bacterium D3-23]
MGASLSWVAVQDRSKAELLDLLGLAVSTAEAETNDSEYFGYAMPSGWYVVLSGRGDLTELPTVPGEQAVACSVEENVMVSIATGWSRGECTWRITHDSEQGIEHLETEGDLPDCFASIRDGLFAEQAQFDAERPQVDYIFDIPVQVAKALTGYDYADPEMDEEGNYTEIEEEVLVRVRDAGGKVKASQLDDLPGSKGCLLLMIAVPSATIAVGMALRSVLQLI